MRERVKQIATKRWIWVIVLCLLSIWSITIGVQDFALIDFLKGNQRDVQLALISRIPRLISIVVTGASLSIAGLIMQTITSNRFVSPSTAGMMEWCKFGIMLAILFAGGKSTFFKTVIAFITAILGTLLFLRIINSLRLKNAVMVPLIGMMLGNVISALTSFVAYKYDIIQNISSWLQGSFSLIVKGRYELLYLGIPLFLVAYVFAHRFTIAGMGESFSSNLGVNYKATVMLGLIIVALITTTVVVTVGSIPFIGLIIPNIISIIKGDNLKNSIFDTAMFGAIFVLGCDMLSRTLISPYEIPISVIISIIGSVIFLSFLVRRNQHA